MTDKNFWFITLCVLLIISVYTGLNVYLRIAIAANAIVILLDVIKQLRRFTDGGREKKN